MKNASNRSCYRPCLQLAAALLVFSVATVHAAPATKRLAAAAKEGSGSHGGDDVELEFAVAAKRAAGLLEAHCELVAPYLVPAECKTMPWVTAYVRALRNEDRAIHVVATDKTLRDKDRKVRTAINDRAVSTVQVNRARWQAIRDPAVRLGLVAHEMVVVAGLTDDPDYEFSTRIAQAYLGTRSSCRAICVVRSRAQSLLAYGADRAQALNRLLEECESARGLGGRLGAEVDDRGYVTKKAHEQNVCIDL